MRKVLRSTISREFRRFSLKKKKRIYQKKKRKKIVHSKNINQQEGLYFENYLQFLLSFDEIIAHFKICLTPTFSFAWK